MENKINQDSCIKCKLCIEVCPVNIIGIDNNGRVNFIPERENICLECGQCMAICSTDSIKIKKYSYQNNFSELPENGFNYQQYIDFISSRRSVRNFKNKAVEKETIEKILNSLSYAPYGAKPNKVEITVVNNRKTIEKTLPLIEEFLDKIIKWVDSPIVSRIIKYKKGIETFNTLKNHLYPISKLKNYKLKYGDRITRGAPALIILHADKGAEEHTNNSLIYATYLLFAIHSLKLGGTMNGILPAAINKNDKIKQSFNIPKNHEAIISIVFGYPKYKYRKSIKRESKKINWIE
ncbi:MAG: nitroreductase family protein [Bacteroidales bacterium]|nr:nitroreductase family protein [Bacteroidales bacterium]